MLRGQLKDFSSWMVCLRPEPLESNMFGSKTSGTSTFYTDLHITDEKEITSIQVEKTVNRNSRLLEQQSAASEDGNSQDSDSVGGQEEQTQYPRHSFHRIASFGGFPRFRLFVMSTATPTVCTESNETEESTIESSFTSMSHSVLEYRSSRYVVAENSFQSDYAVSESESDEESEETRSSETDSAIVADHVDDLLVEHKLKSKKNASEIKRKKTKHIANELLSTEKKYVIILYLIDQIFQFRVDQENRAHPMFPPETVQHMFSNIKSIYKFHNDFLLPQLEERIEAWDADPRIGDIMKNFAPFLKMYTEYVKNFDHAINLISTLQQKVPRFAAIISEIQKLEECAKLSLAHHMLSPIQRLPRYELLLKDYLKNLVKDNPDYEDTKKALELVSTAANHTNEAMKKIDKFKKLLEIQESIYDSTDLVSATRELVKEGRIVKISARSGDHQERHMFLFSDILLLCSLRLIPGPLYRLRARFSMENLQVIEGDNLETANTFYLRDENKSYTDSVTEKAAWLDALFETMQEIMRRKASLKTSGPKTAILKADDVTRCMVCEVIFSVMKRKHNCRACGIVVCSKCSNQKLMFEDNKQMRVCRLCHAALTQPMSKSSPSSPNGPAPSLLQVAAGAASVLSGYLLLKTQASKPWTRRWFALHVDFVLYTFKTESERTAMTATPMPGFTVTEGTDLPDEDPLNTKDRIRAFKIHHSRKSYYLQASSQSDKERWLNALQLATKAELPQSMNEAKSAQHDSQ
ncbi:PREDICTED: FYVE, RhoGEF and PH domain-containing protein 1-like [Ceratosolen solmsi marchali]|uniref:FYVE, RhoGEF and PH domain-containing protein 1-like n=1 Tax=Ceratosolen solmsi marchali TaxID=326594 RepID=A0AAJ6YEQ8_9HYME|nr:PREDICTED: FYVE, RhoGEF and PH domain-containing protein 1-like [Ceratosolen solmsi marchali]XP_011496687.1 PREDICTED: FYVE, RhoGEF and PH domain-containing protein 1-like [Ceratosolen solmsi marchali]